MAEKTPADTLKAALVSSLGFATAITTVHLAVGIALIISMGMPPMTWFAAKSVLIELPLGLTLGLLLSPLFFLPRGRTLHPIGMALAYIGLEYYVAVDPSKLQMWVGPVLGASALFFLFRWLGRRRPLIPAVAGVAAPLLLLLAPVVRHQLAGGYASVENPQRGQAPEGAPDVLMIVMDTTRAQNVSAYGYERETTPNFDKLASEGVLFADATAPATWSLPAHAALFTGTFPSVNAAHSENRYLGDTLPTLAETMAAAGWETRCFTANPHISESFGLTRGFDWTDQAWITGAGGRGFSFIYRLLDTTGFAAEDKGGGQVIKNLHNWMDERPADAPPAFVFVNFLEAHFPFHQLPEEHLFLYTDKSLDELRDYGQTTIGVQFGRQLTDEEYATIRQPILDMYDGGVHYTDWLVGETLKMWEERGTLDNTVVVILGDHGEMVGEHRSFGHLMPVYEEALRVPLAFRYPPAIEAGSVVEKPVSTLGTFATLLDLLGLPEIPNHQVKSLMPTLSGGPGGEPIIAERFEEHMLASRFAPGTANGVGPLLKPTGRYRVFRSGSYKLVYHSDGGVWMYDLDEDPGEMSSIFMPEGTPVDEGDDKAQEIYRISRELEEELAMALSAWNMPDLNADVVVGGSVPQMDAAAEEQLRALGYIE